MDERGRLLNSENYEHSYPHCWRHKSPIIFRATPQWFVSMNQNGLLDTAMKAADDVQWLPEWGKARIESMMQERPDWCISRQRTWGVPIALFVHKQTAELHPDTPALIEKVAQRVEKEGIDGWFELDAAELLGDDAEQYEKVTDTLDVWFDSGVTHHAVLNQREQLQYPADLYLEGSDQHRGWFQSSLLSAIAVNGNAPYTTVLPHGFTVDTNGHKMSKSLGNVIAPQEVMNDLGADVLRLWVAATDYRGEMTVSKEIFKRTADSYRRIRNTSRFLLANMAGFDPANDLVNSENMLSLDRWIVHHAAQLQEEIRGAYNRYQFHQVYQKLHNFCVVELGGFYLDVIKDRQYTTGANSLARRSAQTALYHIAQAMTRWMAPILSFTADELWENLPGAQSGSVFAAEWYTELARFDDPERGDAFWTLIQDVKAAVNKAMEEARNNKVIGGSLQAEVTLYCDKTLQDELAKLGDELRFVLITSKAVVADLSQRTDAVGTELDNLEVAIRASEGSKCVRCWHHREDVGTVEAHPELCVRCVDNIEGDGEQRSYA